MKKLIILIFLASWCNLIHAQNDTLPFASFAQRDTFNKVNARRSGRMSFSHQTLNYSPLSYACPPFLDLGSPKKYYILSADIIPQFISASSRLPFTIQLTARYKVRIFHNDIAQGDSSLPVRTPSFMPGATVYAPLGKVYEGKLNINYVGLAFFHHSNGQDGNAFKSNGSFIYTTAVFLLITWSHHFIFEEEFIQELFEIHQNFRLLKETIKMYLAVPASKFTSVQPAL